MSNSTHRKWRQIKMKKQRRRNVSSFLLLFNLFKISTKICKENPDFSSSAPKCGFIKGNEKIMMLLEKVEPEIVAFRETIITVSHRSGCQNTSAVQCPLWPPSVAAGFLLDSAPHSKNRRWEWLWSCHPGNLPRSKHRPGSVSDTNFTLYLVFSRKKSWSESLQWRPKLKPFRPTSTSRLGAL